MKNEKERAQLWSEIVFPWEALHRTDRLASVTVHDPYGKERELNILPVQNVGSVVLTGEDTIILPPDGRLVTFGFDPETQDLHFSPLTQETAKTAFGKMRLEGQGIHIAVRYTGFEPRCEVNLIGDSMHGSATASSYKRSELNRIAAGSVYSGTTDARFGFISEGMNDLDQGAIIQRYGFTSEEIAEMDNQAILEAILRNFGSIPKELARRDLEAIAARNIFRDFVFRMFTALEKHKKRIGGLDRYDFFDCSRNFFGEADKTLREEETDESATRPPKKLVARSASGMIAYIHDTEDGQPVLHLAYSGNITGWILHSNTEGTTPVLKRLTHEQGVLYKDYAGDIENLNYRLIRGLLNTMTDPCSYEQFQTAYTTFAARYSQNESFLQFLGTQDTYSLYKTVKSYYDQREEVRSAVGFNMDIVEITKSLNRGDLILLTSPNIPLSQSEILRHTKHTMNPTVLATLLTINALENSKNSEKPSDIGVVVLKA